MATLEITVDLETHISGNGTERSHDRRRACLTHCVDHPWCGCTGCGYVYGITVLATSQPTLAARALAVPFR